MLARIIFFSDAALIGLKLFAPQRLRVVHKQIDSRVNLTISERHLLRLQLSEEVLRVVQDTRRITSPGARARALRLVRQELRGLDLGLLRERLEDLSHPNARRASTPADDWRKRLLDGGEAEFAAFLEQYARAERQHLRTLLRNALAAPAASKNKALGVLTQALRDAMSAS